MKIIYKTGSLLDAEEPYLAHGCNAQGKMGAGIAPLIKKRFPEAFTEYRATYERQGDRLDLGQVVAAFSDGKTILNLVTQDKYGRDKTVLYADYDAIRRAMATVDGLVDQGAAVAMPLIGAGLANGKWSVISGIIEDEAKRFSPVVYLLDGVIPEG